MRCVCCNTILTDSELLIIKDDGEFEDMCSTCISHAYNKFTVYDLSWTKDKYDFIEDLDDIITVSDLDFIDFD